MLVLAVLINTEVQDFFRVGDGAESFRLKMISLSLKEKAVRRTLVSILVQEGVLKCMKSSTCIKILSTINLCDTFYCYSIEMGIFLITGQCVGRILRK